MMAHDFGDILGNERLRERLGRDIRAGKLSHAYILEGAPGFGKHLTALEIAAALACEHRESEDHSIPCQSCPSCRKILSGNSPDVIYVNRGEYATLGVDVIRSMHADVYVAPNDCEKKVYIIEEAHLMTTQAQNALLLILEEPPSYVQFLLLCDSAEALLETIRSRAPVLRLQPIDQRRLDEHLCQTVTEARMLKSQSPDEFEEILIASGGSVGVAKKLLDPAHRGPILERRTAAREFLSLCGGSRNSLASLHYLSGLGSKRDAIIKQLEENLICLRDLLVCKQAENAPLCFFTKREEACELSYRFSTPELFRICEGLERAMTSLQANANVRLTLTQLAIEIGMTS